MTEHQDTSTEEYPTMHWSRLREDVAVIIWLSFLVACVATMIFFACIDPQSLIDALSQPRWLPNRMTGYALGFFFFWLIAASAASLTAYMLDTSHEHFATPTADSRERW